MHSALRTGIGICMQRYLLIVTPPKKGFGFLPFKLVYGHTVRGPMLILRELWTKYVTDPDIKTNYQYVVDLKDRLQ